MSGSPVDSLMLYAFRDYLLSLPPTAELRSWTKAIDEGAATIRNSDIVHLLQSLLIAYQNVVAISDLTLLILRNHTAYPFIFGDVPAVFSNHYMRDVHGSGVLGFLNRGLMIFMPIDNKTHLLLYDSAVYSPDYTSAGCIDIFNKPDVSQLNALQSHASQDNVYFSDLAHEEYICELLTAHRALLRNQRGEFVVHGSGEMLIDGRPNEGELLHIFEPQLPVTPDLSFFTTASIPNGENPSTPRNPEIAALVHSQVDISNSRLPIEEFAQWMKSEIQFIDNNG